MPIDRKHLIGHADVPDGRGGRGGSSHHTDPGPHWNWALPPPRSQLAGVVRLSVKPLLPDGPLRGSSPGAQRRHRTSAGSSSSSTAASSTSTGVGRSHIRSTRPGSRTAATSCRCTGSPAQAATTSRARRFVDNKTSPSRRRRAAVDAGAEQDPAAGAAVGPEGGEGGVQGRRHAALGRPSAPVPLLVEHEAGEARQARARGGRDLDRRPRRHTADPARRSGAAEAGRTAEAKARAGRRHRHERHRGSGAGRSRRLARRCARACGAVEFLVDGVLRGSDVAAPYTLGLNADAEQPGEHQLTARAVGANGKAVEATVTVSVPPPSSGTG